MDISRVIVKPYHTEKTYSLQQEDVKKYAFVVDKKANKHEIRDAFIAMFGIEPESINTMLRKPSRTKKATYYPGWKKAKKIAYITLPAGAELFADEEATEAVESKPVVEAKPKAAKKEATEATKTKAKVKKETSTAKTGDKK